MQDQGPQDGEPSGLTSAQAAAAFATHGPNELPQARRRTLPRLALDVLRDPMFLLLVSCGALYLLLGDYRDALMLLGFVVLVIGITVYQEHKTERALAALRQLASPRALAIRDGVRRRIPARELVPDDIVAIAEGDRVPADGVLVSGAGITLDESPLTGESAPVSRSAVGGETRAYLGTLVLQGQALMQVKATGQNTAIGGIGRALTTLEHPVTRLETETRRVVRALAVGGLAVSALVAAGYALGGAGWVQGALAGLTLAMSILPEEFPVVLTVFLALGAWRLAHHRVLTRRMNAIETLGAASVLCVDKTGTLTLNRMRLAAVHDGAREYIPAASAGSEEILLHGALASAQHPFDPMEQALRAAVPALSGSPVTEQLLREYPLSHGLFAMTRVWRHADGKVTGSCKGAPEAVLGLCRLPPAQVTALEHTAVALAARGWRVLGVAAVRNPQAGRLPNSQQGLSFRFLGFVAFEDPLRPGVSEAVRECIRAGIRVIMVTGDHRETAAAIAAEAGLPDPERTLGGDELERLDDATLSARLVRTHVFCRITPVQKFRLVRLLQEAGNVVAMTGDGVNDAPALKAADIGIAMGARGTDVAREAADIVLADDDFPSIVHGVRMGRRIHDNLARAITYIIAVHVPIVGLAVLPLAAGWPLLLMPIHVVLVQMVIDPACSVVLEAEPEESDLMDRPPRELRDPLFAATRVRWGLLQGLFGLLAVIAACSIGVVRGVQADILRSIAVVSLMLVNLALVQINRAPVTSTTKHRNVSVWWVAGAAVVALSAAILVPGLRDLFHLGKPGILEFSAAAGAALVASGMLMLLRRRMRGI